MCSTGHCGPWADSPSWWGPYSRLLASPDPAAIQCQQQVSVLMEGIITLAIGNPVSFLTSVIGPAYWGTSALALVGWSQRMEQREPGARRARGGRGFLLPADIYAEALRPWS